MGQEAILRHHKKLRNANLGTFELPPVDEGWESRNVRDFRKGDWHGLMLHIGDLIANMDISIVAAKQKHKIRHILNAMQDNHEIKLRLEDAVRYLHEEK